MVVASGRLEEDKMRIEGGDGGWGAWAELTAKSSSTWNAEGRDSRSSRWSATVASSTHGRQMRPPFLVTAGNGGKLWLY